MSITDLVDRVAFVLESAFFVLFPLELWSLWRRRRLDRETLREMAASASPFLVTALLASVTTAFITWLFEAASGVAWMRIPTNLATALVCLVLCDFLYYVDHRAGHRVRLYWAVSHSVHHSSPRYDPTTALRVSFVDGYTSPWFQVPAVLIGFHPMLVFACFGLVIAYQTWIHTEAVGTLGWLDGVLNTPSNHRVHHSSLPAHLDKNYGGILIVWDRLFGTYAPETEPVTYGLTTPLASTHPVVVHLSEAAKLLEDLRATRPEERLAVLFRGPEYVPRRR